MKRSLLLLLVNKLGQSFISSKCVQLLLCTSKFDMDRLETGDSEKHFSDLQQPANSFFVICSVAWLLARPVRDHNVIKFSSKCYKPADRAS
jgi:hypothetical protein